MCGIVGVMYLASPAPTSRYNVGTFLFSSILKMSKARGEDSTGVTALFGDGNYLGLKRGVDSEEFLADVEDTDDINKYSGFLKAVQLSPVPPTIMLGHCRKGSMGSLDNTNNMHPIKVGPIVGIHNGTLTNHDVIFKMLGAKRDGTVDSEAIFRLLAHFTDNGKQPFSLKMLAEVSKHMHGSFSTLAFNGNNPYQAAGMRSPERPMEIASINSLGVVLVASEKRFIEASIMSYNTFAAILGNKEIMPMLDLDEIQFKTIPDNSAVIFNLLVEATPETKIEEIVTVGPIPQFAVDKKWAPGTAYYAADQKKSTTPPVTTPAAAPPTVPQNPAKLPQIGFDTKTEPDRSKTDSGTSSGAGLVYNKMVAKFVRPDKAIEDKLANSGAVEVPLSAESVSKAKVIGKIHTVPDEGKGAEAAFVEVELVNDNALPEDVIDIMALPPADGLDPEGEGTSDEGAKVPSTNIVLEELEDPVLIAESEAAAATLPKLDTTDEVLALLNVGSYEALKALPPYALVNRISAAACKKGYLMCAKKAEEGNSASPDHIKFLKHAFLMLSSTTLQAVNKGNTKTLRELIFQEARRAKDKGQLMSLAQFDAIFSKGNIRDTEALFQLRNAIESVSKAAE